MNTENNNRTKPTYEELERRVEELEKENTLLQVHLFNTQANCRKLRMQYHQQCVADRLYNKIVNTI